MGLHFLRFGFLGLISFHVGLLSRPNGPPGQDLVKIAIFLLNFALFPFQKFAALGLHFGLLGLHVLTF